MNDWGKIRRVSPVIPVSVAALLIYCGISNLELYLREFFNTWASFCAAVNPQLPVFPMWEPSPLVTAILST